MAYCQCAKISKLKQDIVKLKEAKKLFEQTWQVSTYTVSARYNGLSKAVINGATPNNVDVFLRTDSILEKPIRDSLYEAMDKCTKSINKINLEIQRLTIIDEAYHAELERKAMRKLQSAGKWS